MDGLYEFDDADDALTLLPTAARRALDAAGLKLSLRAWQAMDPGARRALVRAGAGAAVDAAAVERLVSRATPPPERVPPRAEPDAARPPPEVGPVDAAAWAALRPLDRYALVKSARRPEKLARAREEILGRG